LGEGEGVAAIAFRGRGDRIEIHAGASAGGLPQLAQVAAETNHVASTRALELVYRSELVAASLSEVFGADSALLAPVALTSGGRYRDTVGIVAHANIGAGVAISSPRREIATMARSVRPLWARAALHAGAGMRLRLAIEDASLDAQSVEAVLDANAHVHDARGRAKPASARDALRAAVATSERARGRMRRESPEAALALWEALVSGRWSLVDHFDRDGRRFVVAHRNEPGNVDPRGLARRERQAAEHLGRGFAPKQIAYALGLAPATVSNALARARAKLGVRSLAELAALFAPSGLCVRFAELELGGETLAFASAALIDESRLAPLTAAEREVALALVRGATNREIASERGCSERTIANQAQSLYRKLGVSSRSELAAKLQRAPS
ncbi:MAG TPA: LuxR C-terminal-related transcriptional regulator, partial [Myxococcota bacterium]|nr:LuxR C-terminal-related transcriptional regulator [Myxococcota bacterium]